MTTYQNVRPITLSPPDCLAIIQRTLADLNAGGVKVRVSPLYGAAGEHTVVIVLEGVDIRDGNLIMTEEK